MSEASRAEMPQSEAAQPRHAALDPLVAEGLCRSYAAPGGGRLEILRDVDLRLAPGEAVAIIGASGAGKSTLLHLLGALDRPSSGAVRIGGESIAGLGDAELAALRNRHVGFVFQFHHLLREFTALENVMMPQLINRVPIAQARDHAHDLLSDVGLAGRERHKPTELSGGEQQRVAVARALANEPTVLLADEPSGNLDTQTSVRLHDLLFDIRERRTFSMVLVTHNDELASRADRVLRLRDGRLEATSHELGRIADPAPAGEVESALMSDGNEERDA